jgi:hypothetical protein
MLEYVERQTSDETDIEDDVPRIKISMHIPNKTN